MFPRRSRGQPKIPCETTDDGSNRCCALKRRHGLFRAWRNSRAFQNSQPVKTRFEGSMDYQGAKDPAATETPEVISGINEPLAGDNDMVSSSNIF